MRWNTLNTPGRPCTLAHRTALSVMRAMVTTQVHTGTEAKRIWRDRSHSCSKHHTCIMGAGGGGGGDARDGDVLIKACVVGALWLARSLQHFTGVRGFWIQTQHCCTSLQHSRDPLFAFYTDFVEVNKNGDVHYLHKLYMPDHPCCTNSAGVMQREGGCSGGGRPFYMQLLPVEWSTGPPPLVPNRAAYRSGYAFSRATHRSRKWSLSLFISIFKRWSTFSALDEQFWSSSNLSSWLRVPETISSSMTRSASVMDSNKFW